VTKHYSLNPFALDPKTGKSLPPNGGWSIGTTPPPACAQASAKCVEVFYQVPAQSVRCSWTVLVNADGSDGTILDENDDAEHYLLRKVSRDEAKAQVTARKLPVFPPIAVAAHVSGDVIVTVIIGKSGEVDKIASVTGQPMEQRAAIDAAQQWTFAPLIVGTRAIPYSIQLTFMFRGNGLSNSKVYATP
jgi:TonB family protein